MVPLRAGVVNMWEFEVAEFWYADGRCQMYGANENGKSTLQTLTTLILLTGDIRPHNIDTLGGSSKKFRYFVEPTDTDEDRRDTSASVNRGWTWLEFGRLTPVGPRYVTCALYAEARRSSRDLNRTWLVADGPRVREALSLLTGRAVTTPDRVRGIAGVTTFSAGDSYRGELARTLFGSPEPERLDTLAQLLRVLRTPNLGAKLNLPWLSERLRMALPPLTEHEVDVLAEGWDELDQLAQDRDSVKAARDAVDTYRSRAWQPFVSMQIRRYADALVSTVTEFDNVTRAENTAKSTLAQATEAHAHLEAEHERLRGQLEQARVDEQAWRESTAYKDAATSQSRLRDLTGELQRLAGAVQRAESERDTYAARVRAAEQLVAERQRQVEEESARLQTAMTALSEAARDAG